MDMRTLLLVDDNASVLTTLAFIFDARGGRTVVASSGQKALEIAERESIDLALVDLHMPGMDGLTACQGLHQIGTKRGRPIPTWLMSGALTMAAEIQAREAGVIGVLKKPFDVDAFLQAVENFYGGLHLASIPSPKSEELAP